MGTPERPVERIPVTGFFLDSKEEQELTTKGSTVLKDRPVLPQTREGALIQLQRSEGTNSVIAEIILMKPTGAESPHGIVHDIAVRLEKKMEKSSE